GIGTCGPWDPNPRRTLPPRGCRGERLWEVVGVSLRTIVSALVTAAVLLVVTSTGAGAVWPRTAGGGGRPPDAPRGPLAADVTAGQSTDDSSVDAVSADGRFVVFDSSAANLVPRDGNGAEDVFVRDRLAGTTERVSLGAGGREANGASYGWSVT